MVNNIAARSLPTSKKEAQACLGAVGFWRMCISDYHQIVSPLCQVTQEKNDLKWDPEQQRTLKQIKWEIVHPVAFRPVWCFTPDKVWGMCFTVQLGRMVLPGTCGRRDLERLEADFWVLELRIQKIWGLLHPNWKRDPGILWRALSCRRSNWHQSTSHFGTPATSAGLYVQRESPLHASCNWCYME